MNSHADMNECATTPWVCQQNCTNTVGSYICSCGTGYIASQGGKVCTRSSTGGTLLQILVIDLFDIQCWAIRHQRVGSTQPCRLRYRRSKSGQRLFWVTLWVCDMPTNWHKLHFCFFRLPSVPSYMLLLTHMQCGLSACPESTRQKWAEHSQKKNTCQI